MMFVILTAILLVVVNGDDAQYKDECNVWKQEIQRITQHEKNVKVNCKVNDQCSGYSCNGFYTYKGIFTGGKTYEKPVCFGMWMNPCKKPTSVTVYLDQLSDNVTFIKETSKDGNDITPIEGLHEDITIPIFGKTGTVTVELETDLRHVSMNDTPYMTIAIIIKPKVDNFGVGENYPEDMQVQLMNSANLQVPPCDKNVPKTTHKPNQCVENSKPSTGENVTSCSQYELKLCDELSNSSCNCVNASNYITCEKDMWKSCQALNYGTCSLHDPSKNVYYCDCVVNYQLTDGECKPSNPTTTEIPTFTISPNSESSKHSVSKNVIIIVCCSLGAVILALLATGFVIMRYRQHRIRYSIVQNEEEYDDGDVAPINLET